MGALHAALAEQGLGSAMLVPEPVAAATGYAAGARIEPGATVGIYDLGGGRCDATVLRRERDGFVVVGAPEGVEQFGGADLDEVVLAHVRDALGPAWEALDPTDPDVLAAVADLRREATAAKEALSHDTEVLVPVALPGVTHAGAAGARGVRGDDPPGPGRDGRGACAGRWTAPGRARRTSAALVLVGGSSRIPLVPQLLSEEFGRDVTVAPDPLGVVAVGAALVAAGGRRPGRRRADGPGAGRPSPDGRGGRAAGGAGRGRARIRRPLPPPRPRWVRRSGPGRCRSPPGPRPGCCRRGRRAGRTGRRTGDPAARRRGAPVRRTAPRCSRWPGHRSRRARSWRTHPPTTSRPRRIALFASAGALALAVLGGVVAFGIERIGAGAEAGRRDPGRLVGDGHLGAAAAGDDGAGGDAGAEGPAASAAAPGHPAPRRRRRPLRRASRPRRRPLRR